MDAGLGAQDAGDPAAGAARPGSVDGTGEPVDLAQHAGAALLDAAMALVVVDAGVRRAGRRILEAGLDLGAQGLLVALDRQQIVRALRR